MSYMQYRSMIHKKIEYFVEQKIHKAIRREPNPKVRGTVVQVTVKDRKLLLDVQRENSHKVDRIPVANIVGIISSQTGSDRSNTTETSGPSSNQFHFRDITYTALSIELLHVDDDVVWMRDNGTDETPPPLVGKVTFIGKHVQFNGQAEVIAVVLFDEATNTLPKYVPHKPFHRNVIDVNELLPLSVWLDTLGDQTPSTVPTTPQSPTEPVIVHDLINFDD